MRRSQAQVMRPLSNRKPVVLERLPLRQEWFLSLYCSYIRVSSSQEPLQWPRGATPLLPISSLKSAGTGSAQTKARGPRDTGTKKNNGTAKMILKPSSSEKRDKLFKDSTTRQVTGMPHQACDAIARRSHSLYLRKTVGSEEGQSTGVGGARSATKGGNGWWLEVGCLVKRAETVPVHASALLPIIFVR